MFEESGFGRGSAALCAEGLGPSVKRPSSLRFPWSLDILECGSLLATAFWITVDPSNRQLAATHHQRPV